jgi:hypothetical protein
MLLRAEQQLALLANPAAVHVNILRGTLPLTKAQAIHIAGLPANIEQQLATAEARVKDIQQTLRECLEPIEKWTQAYPLDVFPEPDMKEVRRMLGDTLLTQLSASNMRHVITRVWEMLEQARALLPPEGRPVHGDEHIYLSTACHHGLHDRCRKECKFCAVRCLCSCHKPQPPEGKS